MKRDIEENANSIDYFFFVFFSFITFELKPSLFYRNFLFNIN